MNKRISKAIRKSLGIEFQPKQKHRIPNPLQRLDYKIAKREWNAIPRNLRTIHD
jgi:hypothetical protein